MKMRIDFDNIQIATPCVADWDNMEGTDQIRHCTKCEKDVFNISEMTRSDAENLFIAHVGKEQPCIRLYRRRDGTVIIDDCPVGLRKVRDKAKQLYYAASLFVSFIMSCAAVGAQAEKGAPLNTIWDKTKMRVSPGPYEAFDGGPMAPPVFSDQAPQTTLSCRLLGSNSRWTKPHTTATNAAVASAKTTPPNKLVLNHSEHELVKLAQSTEKRKQFILAAISMNNAANCQWYQNRLNDAKLSFAKAHQLAMLATAQEREPVLATIAENMQSLDTGGTAKALKRPTSASWLLTQIGGVVQTAR